ncbi:hypothetical protein Tco_0350194, partial [Tanacetum coccineum]
DKGKGKAGEEEEEADSDSDVEGMTDAERRLKPYQDNEELARKVEEEWNAEEEATKAYLTNEYDFIQARLRAEEILAKRVQEQEREKFTVSKQAKFLHDTIAAQRKFFAQNRSETIRNRPPTKTQLRNQMMTYLKHVGNKKHVDLKSKT